MVQVTMGQGFGRLGHWTGSFHEVHRSNEFHQFHPKLFIVFRTVFKRCFTLWPGRNPRYQFGGAHGADFVQLEPAFLQLGSNKLWYTCWYACSFDHCICADLVPLPSLVNCIDPWEQFHEACEASAGGVPI